MAFSIAEPAEILHVIFRPFVLAALWTCPKTLRADPTPRDRLRSLAALDLVRKHSSLSPVEASKDKFVEADKTLAAKMRNTISDARLSPSLWVPASPIPVLSSGTGFSQYFQGPSPLSPSASSPEHRDLFDLFNCKVPRSYLQDEARERSAAHHYWSMLLPLQLARDFAQIADSTVFTVKQEGLRSLPLPDLRGIQGSVSLTFDHLEDVCARSLTKAVQAKVRIREHMLRVLKPHTLRDPLLQVDLVHPDVFPPAALEAAIPILKAALDANTVRDHAGRVPFRAPRQTFRRRLSPHQNCPDFSRDPRSLNVPAASETRGASDRGRPGRSTGLAAAPGS